MRECVWESGREGASVINTWVGNGQCEELHEFLYKCEQDLGTATCDLRSGRKKSKLWGKDRDSGSHIALRLSHPHGEQFRSFDWDEVGFCLIGDSLGHKSLTTAWEEQQNFRLVMMESRQAWTRSIDVIIWLEAICVCDGACKDKEIWIAFFEINRYGSTTINKLWGTRACHPTVVPAFVIIIKKYDLVVRIFWIWCLVHTCIQPNHVCSLILPRKQTNSHECMWEFAQYMFHCGEAGDEPEGPYKSTPLEGFIPNFSYLWAYSTGYMTVSISSCFTFSRPPTSAQVTSGICTK